MKKLLALLLVFALGLTFAACEKEPPVVTTAPMVTTDPVVETTATPTTEPTPKRENKLVCAINAPFKGDFAAGLFTANNVDLMDSSVAADSVAHRMADEVIGQLLTDYSTLAVQRDGTYAYNMTVLAETPTKVENADGSKTFTMTIRQDLTYNTGKPITARDYVFRTLFVNSAACAMLGGVDSDWENYPNGKAFYNCETPVFQDVRLLSDYSWSVTIADEKVPYVFESTYAAASPWDVAYWLGEGYTVADDGKGCYLAKDGTPVTMNAMLADAVSATFIAARSGKSLPMVTAGPYQLAGFDVSTGEVTLEVNPNYAGNFEGQKPAIETLVLIGAQGDGWVEGLIAGDIHLVDTIEDSSRINTVLDLMDQGKEVTYDDFYRGGYGQIRFACDITPTQFVEVRQAIAHLLPREEIVNMFCQGWGSVVNGPYTPSFWMAQQSEELLKQLNNYEFDVKAAEKLLEKGGWTLDEYGDTWSGEGLRYKEVTQEQAKHMEGCIGLGDTILMPLVIRWAATEDNGVSDILSALLANSPDVQRLGMAFETEKMDYATALSHLYRQDLYGLGGEDFTEPYYSMFHLATGWNSPMFDHSYFWTDDPARVEAALNPNYLYDLGEGSLDQLSMDMVYAVAEEDTLGYLEIWQDYVTRWNHLLPDIPLYANRYITAYPTWLQGYDQDTFWGFQNAVLYASIVEE